MSLPKKALWSALAGAMCLLSGCGGGGGGGADKPPVPALPKQKIEGVLITSLPSAPGWAIAETKGFNCYGFGFSGNGKYWGDFNEAQSVARADAAKAGANAWVNVKVSSASFEAQGSKWHMSITHLCGDFVVLK